MLDEQGVLDTFDPVLNSEPKISVQYNAQQDGFNSSWSIMDFCTEDMAKLKRKILGEATS